MRQLTLLLLAAFLFTSCDNLKTKDSSKTDEDTEETTTKKKKKKALDDEEESEEEEPTTTKKKKRSSSDDEVTDDESANDEETTSDYAKGWSKADRQNFVSTCAEKASSKMGQEKAEEYCTCMMNKIEKRYPNSADVQQLTESDITKLAMTCVQ